MTKRTALWLIYIGVGLQVADLVTKGKVFGEGGILKPVDQKIPKVDLPWPSGAQTNLAFWLIVVGAIGYVWR
ncbi:MAG: hypothetical protein QXJ16_01940 [Desulfurococcaceae archaeon]